MTYKGFDLTPLLGALITIFGSLLGWVSVKVAGAADAAKDERSAAAALARVGALVTTILGRSWDRLAPQVRSVIADGQVTDEERALIELAVKSALREFISEEELGNLAKALKLPLPGLIAKIAAMALDTFTKAHDPGNQTVSELAFPAEKIDYGQGG